MLGSKPPQNFWKKISRYIDFGVIPNPHTWLIYTIQLVINIYVKKLQWLDTIISTNERGKNYNFPPTNYLSTNKRGKKILIFLLPLLGLTSYWTVPHYTVADILLIIGDILSLASQLSSEMSNYLLFQLCLPSFSFFFLSSSSSVNCKVWMIIADQLDLLILH